jgi:predicted Zn-dependent protease
MNIETKYELFEAYLDNSLTAQEQIAFDALMLDEATLAEFDEYKSIHNQYAKIVKNEKEELDFIANLKQISGQYNDVVNIDESAPKNTPSDLNTYVNQQQTISDSKKTIDKINLFTFTRNIKLGIAATILIVFGLYFYNNLNPAKQDMQSLFASNYTVDDLSLERGSANDSLENITALYNAKKYKEAFPIIKTYSQSHNDNGNIKIALATCYFEASDFVNTEYTLQNLIVQNDAYKEKAQWYLAMCYIKQEKKAKAIALLSSFEKDHFYAEKAKQILKDLQRD